jgi:hypothetical protein
MLNEKPERKEMKKNKKDPKEINTPGAWKGTVGVNDHLRHCYVVIHHFFVSIPSCRLCRRPSFLTIHELKARIFGAD